MPKNIRLSIVIPVYNLENYIEKTLDSCLAQDIPQEEYEIICIDDGSKDGSLAILNRYAQKHPNIIVHFKENGGVSSARNTGIDLARGQYIWFVDGDDMIAGNTLGAMLQYAEENFLDLFKFNLLHTSERTTSVASFSPPTLCDIPNEIASFMTAKGGIGGGACVQWFRRELLLENNIRFSENIHYSEDVLFSYRSSICSKRAAKTDSILYFYYQRPGSALHRQDHRKHADSMYLLALEYDKMALTYQNSPHIEKIKVKQAHALRAMILSLVQLGDVQLLSERLDVLTEKGLYPFPFRKKSLRNNQTWKQAIINYASFLFPCRWYAMFCVHMVALIKKIRK